MPLFEQLYNFAQWMTHNREEAEDLVLGIYAKALKGFPSFRLTEEYRYFDLDYGIEFRNFDWPNDWKRPRQGKNILLFKPQGLRAVSWMASQLHGIVFYRVRV
jgi:hypothetical protein